LGANWHFFTNDSEFVVHVNATSFDVSFSRWSATSTSSIPGEKLASVNVRPRDALASQSPSTSLNLLSWARDYLPAMFQTLQGVPFTVEPVIFDGSLIALRLGGDLYAPWLDQRVGPRSASDRDVTMSYFSKDYGSHRKDRLNIIDLTQAFNATPREPVTTIFRASRHGDQISERLVAVIEVNSEEMARIRVFSSCPTTPPRITIVPEKVASGYLRGIEMSSDMKLFTYPPAADPTLRRFCEAGSATRLCDIVPKVDSGGEFSQKFSPRSSYIAAIGRNDIEIYTTSSGSLVGSAQKLSADC